MTAVLSILSPTQAIRMAAIRMTRLAPVTVESDSILSRSSSAGALSIRILKNFFQSNISITLYIDKYPFSILYHVWRKE